MTGFLKSLSERNLLNDWVDVIDWLFNDDRFTENGWNQWYLGSFTKKLKRNPIFKDLKCEKLDDLKFPNEKEEKRQTTHIIISGDSEGKSLVKHIRNGIVHGNARITGNNKTGLYIKIKDYTNDKKEKQTAYISLPLNCIIEIYNLYLEMNKSINNTKPRGRKTDEKNKSKRKKKLHN